MLEFNATVYLSRIQIVHVIKNVKTKTKHLTLAIKLPPYSSLPPKKSTGATSISLICTVAFYDYFHQTYERGIERCAICLIQVYTFEVLHWR